MLPFNAKKSTLSSRVMTVWIKLQFAIYSAQVVYKAWGYGCLPSFITSFCLPPHGPHTVPRECDERQWVIDARGDSAHLLCSSGGVFLRDAQPLWEVLGCGKLQLGRDGETPQLSNASFHQNYIIPHPSFFPSHIKRSWGEVCLLVRPVDGLHWAFGCPKTWSPSSFFPAPVNSK